MNRNAICRKNRLLAATILLLPQALYAADESFPQTTGTQWYPRLEGNLKNPSFDGNPFDVEAKVIFIHRKTGRSATTSMFYDGGDTWRFRFTAIFTGQIQLGGSGRQFLTAQPSRP
jgi:hypothetical protein